jgi:membrane fusion protein (multidrug efflux system)
MNRVLTLTGLLLAAFSQPSASTETERIAVTPPPDSSVRVEVAVLFTSVAEIVVSLPGEVEAVRDADVASALGGLVQAVLVSEGDRIRLGQPLARIDVDLHQVTLDIAMARLEAAQAEVERTTRLGDLATQTQLVTAATQLKIAQAGLTQAQAILGRATVRAPFSGVVATVNLEIGEVAGPGSTVARIVKLDPAQVTLAVADRDVVTLRVGDQAQVTTHARSGIVTGVISHIAPAANPKTRAFRVIVDVPNANRDLLPGMIAQVQVARVLAEDALIIPQDWVVTRLADQGVFIDVDGIATWRPITLGDIVRDQVVISEGVSAGDRLIVTGHRDLVHGDKLLSARQGTCCTQGRVDFR